jgi:hypothetical protein
MSGSGDFDFLSQIPLQVLLAPIFFGVLWVISMAVIFRRAKARKERARDALGLPPQPSLNARVQEIGSKVRIALPSPAPSTAFKPAPVLDVPEPDLDLLTMPLMLDDITDAPAASPTPTAKPPSSAAMPLVAPKAMIEPAQEEIPFMPQSLTPSPDAPQDAVEVLRIYRDLSDGSLIFQVGKEYFRSPAEIRNPEIARRFNTVAQDLVQLMGNAPAAGAATNQAKPNITPLSADPLPPLNPGTVGSMKVRAADISSIKPKGLFGRPPAPEPLQAKNLVQAVEEFLQHKLASTPEMSARSIHIRPSANQGIVVEVDGHYYDGIDAVVDARVREFLKNMMREWEARQ